MTNPTQPTATDQLARECAMRVSNYMAHCGHYVHGANSIESIIAATLRPVVEERDRLRDGIERERNEANERMQLVMDAEAFRSRKIEMERNRISRERDQLRAALDQAEGALKRAKPHVVWSDPEGRQECDYPEASAVVKADVEAIDHALARIAAARNQSP